MNGIQRSRRLLTVVTLLLCATPAFAQGVSAGLVCSPIGRGDTAARLAQRLTGDAAAAYSDTFQILDPSRKKFVPKSQYRRLRAGWQACVTAESATRTISGAAPVVPQEPAVTSTPLASGPAPLRIAAAGVPFDLAFAATLGAAVFFVLSISAALAGVLTRPIPPPMQRAGETFVNAFARPLVDLSSEVPPILTRLRFSHRRQQLEISIAPGPGHSYPNLVDHKRNVEYDVKRVMRLLGTRFVVSDRLRAAGKWVVVPIRQADVKHTGVK